MTQDLRVPMDPILRAFGLAILVTRPTPDAGPVSTTGVWMPALSETPPYGTDFRRLGARKVMTIPTSAALPTIPRGSVVDAPEYLGGPTLRWQTDGASHVAEHDALRVTLVRVTDQL